MAFATDPSERDRIDNVLRLPGLKFPKSMPVIGKKDIDLMLALGAIDTKRHRAGNQLLVVQRLCILYQAVISVDYERPLQNIDDTKFYEIALISISDKHRPMTKYLTPESLRDVIDLYRKAFARSGWKVIEKTDEDLIRGQMADADFIRGKIADMAQRDAAQSGGGSRGEQSNVGETVLKTTEDTTEILEPIEPVGDRVKLEELVRKWMVIRGRANVERQKAPTPPETEGPFLPQQKPDESAHAYLLRLDCAFRDLHEENACIEEMNTALKRKTSEQYDEFADEIAETGDRCEALLVTVDDKSDHIKQKYKEIKAKNKEINERDNKIHQMKKQIAKKEKLLAEKEKHIVDKEEQITQKNQQIIEKNDRINESYHKSLEYHRRILEKNLQVVEKSRQIFEKNLQIMEKDDRIKELEQRLSAYGDR